MLDQLIKMTEGPLQEYLNKSQLPSNKETVQAIGDTFSSAVQKRAQSGNFDAVLEMFSGKSTGAGNPLINNLAGDMSQGLMEKLGLDSKQAISLASAVLPILMNFFNQRVNDAPQANGDIMTSIIESLKGGGGGSDILGSLLSGEKGSGMDLGGLINMGKGLFGKS